MGITQADVPGWNEHDDSAREYYHLTPGPDAICGHCLGAVEHPCIYWALPAVMEFGRTEDVSATLYLHKGCAVSFVRSLLQDVERMDRLEELAQRLVGSRS